MKNSISNAEGILLFEQGKYLDAIEFYHKFNGEDPSWDASYNANKIALCYEKLGMFYSALHFYGIAAENEAIDKRNLEKYIFYKENLDWNIKA